MVRKKKAELKNEVIESADIAEMVNEPRGWPKITQGTHLTVFTYEDGRTELMWDDKQLAKEVREAIEQYELTQPKPNTKAKVATRKKKV